MGAVVGDDDVDVVIVESISRQTVHNKTTTQFRNHISMNSLYIIYVNCITH